MPFKAESFKAETATEPRSSRPGPCACAWEGCPAEGLYRAPRDKALRSYITLCLDHVRAYNAGWDYHKGCTLAELEAEIRSAATWERPTWKLGTLGGGRRRFKVDDPFGFAAGTAFDPEDLRENRKERPDSRDETTRLHAARMGALKVLELTWPVTRDALKQRYKALVKKHHPDANGGSAEAETHMKCINEAYQTLRAELA